MSRDHFAPVLTSVIERRFAATGGRVAPVRLSVATIHRYEAGLGDDLRVEVAAVLGSRLEEVVTDDDLARARELILQTDLFERLAERVRDPATASSLLTQASLARGAGRVLGPRNLREAMLEEMIRHDLYVSQPAYPW